MEEAAATKETAWPRRKAARDHIGYCRKNHPIHGTTAEIMKELREGEE